MGTRAGTYYDRDGDRWYKNPSNPTSSYAGVTSILNSRNKAGLVKAKTGGVAKYAAAHRKALAEMTQAGAIALLKSQDEVFPDWVVAREFGTATHQVVENIVNGRALDEGLEHVEGTKSYPVDNTFTTWVPKHWDSFTKTHRVNVIDVEQTVFNHSLGYAGSYDQVVKIDGITTILDVKSNANGPHADVALQCSLYAHAEVIMDMATGSERPMHDIEQAAVLWMRPEGFALYPLQFDEEVWKTAYALLLVHRFSKVGENEAIGERISGNLEIKRWH